MQQMQSPWGCHQACNQNIEWSVCAARVQLFSRLKVLTRNMSATQKEPKKPLALRAFRWLWKWLNWQSQHRALCTSWYSTSFAVDRTSDQGHKKGQDQCLTEVILLSPPLCISSCKVNYPWESKLKRQGHKTPGENLQSSSKKSSRVTVLRVNIWKK